MRWYSPDTSNPFNHQKGDKRVIEKFLWWPKRLKNKREIYETRWLETSMIRQHWSYCWPEWFDDCWIDVYDAV